VIVNNDNKAYNLTNTERYDLFKLYFTHSSWNWWKKAFLHLKIWWSTEITKASSGTTM